MALDRPNCAHCVYWVADPTVIPAKIGHCRRLPPGVAYNSKNDTLVQKFPVTGRNDWCGKWNGDDTGLLEAKREMIRRVARQKVEA